MSRVFSMIFSRHLEWKPVRSFAIAEMCSKARPMPLPEHLAQSIILLTLSFGLW
jgi:hypothetical protein